MGIISFFPGLRGVMSWHCSSLFGCQGIAMTLSTTAFGIYFYLMAHIHNPASGEPQTNLAWLALASMGVFITGSISHFPEKPLILEGASWREVFNDKSRSPLLFHYLTSQFYTWSLWLLVLVCRFCPGLGSDPMAGHVGDLPCQSEGIRQRRLCPDQLEHGFPHHQDLSEHDG